MNKTADSLLKEAEVIKEAADQIRLLTTERDELRDKVAGFERRDRAEKVAHQMHAKGLETELPVEKLAERLETLAAQGKLDEVERAVDLIGPDMGSKIASLSNDTNVNYQTGASDLERFVLSGH